MSSRKDKQILISTILSRMSFAIALAEHAFANTGITSLISCQTFEDINIPKVPINTAAYEIVYTDSRGLSNNRNNAIEASEAKYIWILDDDVKVLPQGCLNAFKELEEGDSELITTRYVVEDNNPRKNYKSVPFSHDKLSIMRVSSIEIMCVRETLIKHNVLFDTRFGLGAPYQSGEENVFLSDCLNKGLTITYFPINTSKHPDETSGGNYNDKLLLISKGAIIRRVYGVLGFPIVVGFFVKKLLNKELSPRKAIYATFYGIKGFFNIIPH